MKTKLLKKVRKRFAIVHLPNGFVAFGNHFNYNLLKLVDNYNEYNDEYAQIGWKPGGTQFSHNDQIFDTREQAINYLKDRIIIKLKMEGYLNKQDREILNQTKKIWHT